MFRRTTPKFNLIQTKVQFKLTLVPQLKNDGRKANNATLSNRDGFENKHVLLFLLLREKTNNTKNMFCFVEGKKKYFKKCVFERTNLGKQTLRKKLKKHLLRKQSNNTKKRFFPTLLSKPAELY